MPNHLGTGRDSIHIGAKCNELLIKLKAEGKPNNYLSDTKCEIELNLTTTDFDTYVSVPYPNPSQGKVRLTIRYDEKIDVISIYDTFGNEKENYKYSIISNKSTNTYDTQIELDLNSLGAGIYFVRLPSLRLVKAILLEK